MKKKDQIVKRVETLTKEELEQIVESIQGWLWVHDAPADAPKNLKNCEVWNPEGQPEDKGRFLDDVMSMMAGYGLKPTKIVKFEG